MPFIETGISARIHFRKMFDNVDDVVRDVNKYKTYSNIYHSIYKFRETEEKFNFTTGKTNVGPNYETAMINKVVLDLDSFEKTKRLETDQNFEFYTPKALEDIRTLESWSEKRDLRREYRFSGGGFYFIFSARGHPLKLRDFEIKLMQELGVNIDISTIGDTSRLMRVTNSFNFKEYRKVYCIPLRKEELYLPYEEIKKLAEFPRVGERFLYGKNTYDFNSSKIDEHKIKLKKLKIDIRGAVKMDANEILSKYGWEIDDFCDTIKGILSLSHKGNALRWELIKYFKSIIRLNFEDCVTVMVSLLGSEGVHSAIEGQAKYAYGYNKHFNPDWKLKPLGYCPSDCEFCKEYRSMSYNIKINERYKNE